MVPGTLVPNTNIIDCKWVYRLKRDKDGTITRYKAMFNAKGFRQQPSVDYHETFSPVIKSTTICVVLSLAITQKRSLRQLDVQNAFLDDTLNETVYMKQTLGFIDPKYPHRVCLLHKSIYGLKKLLRAWLHRLTQALIALSFTSSRLILHYSFTPNLAEPYTC